MTPIACYLVDYSVIFVQSIPIFSIYHVTFADDQAYELKLGGQWKCVFRVCPMLLHKSGPLDLICYAESEYKYIRCVDMK